jgi:3-hydroxyacyl-[acyl-carrier-protein] dehydratase
MLIPDFYTIQQFDRSKEQIFAKLLLNKEHDVYKGHFPDQPVVPGVVQLQIIKELVEKTLEKELVLNEIVSAKYLNMINPLLIDLIDIEINLLSCEQDNYKFDAKILNNETVFLKLKGHFKIKNPD